MATIDQLTLDVADVGAADRFYSAAFDLGDRLRLRPAPTGSHGFRGFTLSLVVAQPATVDALMDAALAAGATATAPAARSLWGYGGAVQAPDGTVWTLASATRKDTGPATRQVDEVVLQLGVADVAASRDFYAERGLTPAKSFGRRYVEYDTGPVKLTLNRRAALAKVAGVAAAGSGPHGLAVMSPAGPFTDPDGFVWEAASR